MLRLFDSVVFAFIAYLAYESLGETAFNASSHQALVIAILLMISLVFSITNVYRDWRGVSLSEEISTLSFSWLMVMLLTGAALFSLKIGEGYSRLWIAFTFGGTFALSLLSRGLLFSLNEYRYRLGKNLKNVVIVGAGEHGRRLADRMLERPWAGLSPRAFFDADTKRHGSEHNGVPVVGDLDFISRFIEHHRRSSDYEGLAIQEVWIALPLSSKKDIAVVRNQLADTAAKVRLVPNVEQFEPQSFQLSQTLDLPVIDFSGLKVDSHEMRHKRAIDIFAAVFGVILLSPFLIFVALLIKIDSVGPVIFKQRRYGLDGREFDLWKFRSMTVEASEFATVEQAQVNDVRVTRVGRWIRKYSIDELPQLINVVLGDMSMVGPRPHATSHNEYYRTKIEGYMSRHSARPGITGWAQVNGLRGETPRLSDMQERLKHDIFYIKNWSLWLDFKILAKTIYVVVSAKGAY